MKAGANRSCLGGPSLGFLTALLLLSTPQALAGEGSPTASTLNAAIGTNAASQPTPGLPVTLADREKEWNDRARTNRVKLDKPLYTNAPYSDFRLRTAALKGDAYAAWLCKGTNSAEFSFWQRLAATNGWVVAQIGLAEECENPAAAKYWRDKAKAALPKLRADAERGDAIAIHALCALHLRGWLVESNQALGLEYLRKAAERGLPFAQYRMGTYFEGQTNYVEAARWYYLAATQGLVRAQTSLLSLHYQPPHEHFDPKFEPDPAQAVLWMFEAANQFPSGDVYWGSCLLGAAYRDGLGVETNYVEAARWFRRASDIGDVAGRGSAEHAFALCCFGGEGVPQDDAEGSKWLKAAVERGYKDQPVSDWADAELARARGDYRTALKHWRKLAAQGDPEAQSNLGSSYAKGMGVPQDYAEAIRWFRKAALQGDDVAQCNLGLSYDQGRGVPQDYTEAVKWFRRSANQGYDAAQNNLGAAYGKGHGAPQDYVEAHKWFNLAAAQGNSDAAKNRDFILAHMTANQIAEAQRLAREFTPRKESRPSGQDQGVLDETSEGVPPKATGTGFFISESGYLVTSQHVAEGGNSIKVRTARGELVAKLIRSDAATDLALLKVEGRFNTLPVKSSRGVRLGETVVTLGFPNPGLQGLSPKLTKGEISSLAGVQDDPKHFQVSLPIQRGNSGGALVDANGNVVGVITAKLSQRASLATAGTLAENVNYAVKSSFLLSFLESVPALADRLNEPRADKRSFEDVVRDLEKATVLVLVY